MNAKFSILLSVALLVIQAKTSVWPQTGINKSAKRLILREVQEKGRVQFELRAQGHTLGELLEAVAAAAELQVTVDPAIRRQAVPKIALAARTLDTLFEMLCTYGKGVTIQKSGSVLHVYAKRNVIIAPRRTLLTVPTPARPSVDPAFVFPKPPFEKSEPKPHRRRFSFNDRYVYLIPVPMKPKVHTAK